MLVVKYLNCSAFRSTNSMSISSLNTALHNQNIGLNNPPISNASLYSLGAALSGGDMTGAKNIFSALSQNSSNASADTTTQSLMGQLGNALNGGNVSQAKQITSALQNLQTQGSVSNPLLDTGSGAATSSSLNDSLFSALSSSDLSLGGATSLAGISSPLATGLVSPAQEIAQNMDTFLKNLLATLQSNASTSPAAVAGSSTSKISNSSAPVKQNPYASTGPNQMSGGLQSLIQQLAKNPNAAAELNTSLDTTKGTNPISNDPQVSQLQNSYDKLISSQGGEGGSAALISFLQNFETNMKSMQPSGGLLNLQA